MPVWIVCGILLLVFLLYLFLIACARPKKEWTAPFQNLQCAHRGLYEKDQSIPENTLEAFARAAEHGYGVELDVQLSKDGEVIVFHDDTVDRETAYTGRVDAYTLSELQAMSLFGTEGREKRIPLFTEVMAVLDQKSPTIVELKSTENYVELCEKTLAILRTLQGPYCVESFDPRIVRWFRLHAPDIMRGQLTEAYAGWRKGMSASKAFGLSHLWTNLVTRPHFIAYGSKTRPLAWFLAKITGAFLVYWTEREADDHARLKQQYDCLIFEHFRPDIHY